VKQQFAAAADRLLRLQEVAGRLGISARSVWRLAARRQLVPVAVMGGKRWPESEVQDFIERAKRERGQ
jgi:predicted DNA-binding transcriptional regulator AlpA